MLKVLLHPPIVSGKVSKFFAVNQHYDNLFLDFFDTFDILRPDTANGPLPISAIP